MNLSWLDWLFADHGPILAAPGAPEAGGSTSAGSAGGDGGSFVAAGTAGCAPSFHPLGDNSAWFVYHGVEVGLVILMLVGILAVLFGNQETDINIADVAGLAAA